MPTVRDIMSSDVVTVTPEMTLRDAMTLFTTRHISGAPVVEGDRVVGVVSAGDLLALASASPSAPLERPPVEGEVAIEPAADVDATASRATPKGAPTEAGDVGGWGELPGWSGPSVPYYTERWGEMPSGVDSPEWSPLDERTVAEAMSDTVIALPPDASVSEAGALMDRKRIHRVLVMQGRRLLGIVSVLDVARAVAEHRLSSRRYVFTPHGRRDEREEADEER